MTLEQRINAFVSLGEFMKQFAENVATEHPANDLYFDRANELISGEFYRNPWFTEANVRQAFAGISTMLQREALTDWMQSYKFQEASVKKVGVIMAGNIPMVGFHDLMCVLLAGHELHAKLASQDKFMIPFLVKVLIHIEPAMKDMIHFHKDAMKNCDAYIATGSNNSARYFEHYFGKYPSVIRKNRNSVAVITGEETPEELVQIGHDIFDYFGLGCRNVTKLYVPTSYDFDTFFKAIYEFKDLANHSKYGNNYDYNKAVYLMGGVSLLENGFVLLKEDKSLGSPVAVLFYERYDDAKALEQELLDREEEIQCVVSHQGNYVRQVAPGEAQCPAVDDYADGVDTMAFLQEL